MRGATIYLIRFLIIVIFLLTRLMRGATVISDSDEFGNKISTHAPHARRDNSMVEKMAAEINFYSRASCEARQHCNRRRNACVQNFYSRASCEARQITQIPIPGRDDFYSRASCEARPVGTTAAGATADFYSRASCEARL